MKNSHVILLKLTFDVMLAPLGPPGVWLARSEHNMAPGDKRNGGSPQLLQQIPREPATSEQATSRDRTDAKLHLLAPRRHNVEGRRKGKKTAQEARQGRDDDDGGGDGGGSSRLASDAVSVIFLRPSYSGAQALSAESVGA